MALVRHVLGVMRADHMQGWACSAGRVAGRKAAPTACCSHSLRAGGVGDAGSVWAEARPAQVVALVTCA